MAKVMDLDAGTGQASAELVRVPTTAAEATIADERPVAFQPDANKRPASGPSVETPTKTRGFPIRRVALAVGAVVVLLVVGNFAYGWWANGRFIVSTDDAYVAADTATVTAKVAGYVMSVPAKDNVQVASGDPLVVLDDADFRNALAQANAKVATGQATIDRLTQQITAGQAAVNSAEAQLASAQAAADNAKADYDRVVTLESKAVASTAALDTSRSALAESAAAVAAAQAGVTVAQANADVATAAKTEAERTLDEDRLASDQAQLNLDHTVVRAPFDGVVGNGAAQPGEYVAPGQRLVAVVPLDAVYVVANFKETQVASLVPGQTAKVTVDAYPGMPITGTVESVAPASGSVFSLLPPENATGNFTKIVQRVAVRIRLPEAVTKQGIIRPGMSIVAAVDTRTGGGPAATH